MQKSSATEGRLYGGLPEAERRADRRERFVQAGVVAFGRDGYAATTTRTLCAEAGLTQRYFYESFKGIDALFEAVAKQLGEELETRLLAAADSAPNDPVEQLRSSLTVYFGALKEAPGVARILLVEVYTAGQRMGELAFRFSVRLGELLESRMLAAFPALNDRDVHPGLLAAGFIGATHHIALKWMLGGFREPVERVVATAMALYLGPFASGMAAGAGAKSGE